VFAELCSHCGTLEKPNEKIEAIYTLLLEYMPPPPIDADLNETPSFQFSHAECLLYALHALGKQCPEYLTFPNDPAKLKDFKARLQYLARGTQGYIKKLQEAVKGKSQEELKSEENQIKVTALKTTSNINTLIRDLFHSPPSYKAIIQLSWVTPKTKNIIAITKDDKKTDVIANQQTTGTKRHAPITFENGGKAVGEKPAKHARTSNGSQLYSPPSGKYSNKIRQGGGGGGGQFRRNRNNNNNNNNRFRSGGGGGGGGGKRSGGNRRFRRY
jgi:hypothetical protein